MEPSLPRFRCYARHPIRHALVNIAHHLGYALHVGGKPQAIEPFGKLHHMLLTKNLGLQVLYQVVGIALLPYERRAETHVKVFLAHDALADQGGKNIIVTPNAGNHHHGGRQLAEESGVLVVEHRPGARLYDKAMPQRLGYRMYDRRTSDAGDGRYIGIADDDAGNDTDLRVDD